jgi:hypothetical protein
MTRCRSCLLCSSDFSTHCPCWQEVSSNLLHLRNPSRLTLRSHQSPNHHLRPRRSQFGPKRLSISCLNILDCLWYPVINSDYSIPHPQDSILHRHGFDFCRWYILCHHSGCNRCSSPNVRHGILPFCCGWFTAPLPRRLWCYYRNIYRVCSVGNWSFLSSSKDPEKSFPSLGHWPNRHSHWRIADPERLSKLGWREWPMLGSSHEWTFHALP